MTDSNDIRYQFYSMFNKNFEFKTYPKNKTETDISIKTQSRLPSTNYITKSYDFNYVKTNLINKLYTFYKPHQLFNRYISFSRTYEKQPFTKKHLYIAASLLEFQDTKFSLFAKEDVQTTPKQRTAIKNFIASNYVNKKIDGIFMSDTYVKFDDIDVAAVVAAQSPETHVDSDKEVKSENILTNMTVNQKYILLCYKQGLFNYYNNIISVINECVNYNNDIYYCNRIKVGAIKTLEYYLMSDLMLEFVKQVKTEKDFLLSQTIYNDAQYDCTSKIVAGTKAPSRLEKDIRYFLDSFINLSSKMNIETELINQKFYKTTQNEVDVQNNDKNIDNLSQNTAKTENIIRTLIDKNLNAYSLLYKNRIILLICAIIVLGYLFVNMMIFMKYLQVSPSMTLLANSVVLVLLILYIIINFLFLGKI